LLIGYCDDEKMDDAMLNDAMLNDAMLVYHEMNEKGFKPNWVSYNIMIRSCFKAARFADAHTLLDELFAQGQTLGQVTYSNILHYLFLHDRFEEAFSLFHLLGDDSKVNSHLYVVHDLMYGAIRCGKLDIARELFEGLSVKRLKPTSIVYTTMIGGYCAEGLLNDAKQLFLEMEENFCLPTDTTFNFLLQGYLQNNYYDDVEMLLHKMEERDHCLYDLTLSLLRESVAAGSLDTSILELMNNLPRSEGVDLFRFFFHD
ncbi:tetratricopeptide repeat-like superfamily protein, partial [Tanacetum coccineum]